MKKRISALLAILMCAGLFMTACSKNPSTDFSSGSLDSVIETSSEAEKEDDTSSTTSTESTNKTSSTGTNKTSSTTSTASKNNTGNKTSSTASKTEANKDTNAVRDLKGRTINYVAYWAELEKGSSQRANTYWKRKEEIEKKYNCKIKHIYKSRDAIDTEVIPSILSGSPVADVFNVQQDRMYSLINKKVVYPLSDLKELNFKDKKWNPAMTAMATVNGKVYGMLASDGPYCNTMLLYNKDYFKANGLPDLYDLQESGKLTWAKFREIAKSATKGSVKGFAMTSADEFMVQSLIHANGGKMVSRGKGLDFTCTLNSKNTINAMQFWQDMRQKDGSVLEPGANGYNYCMEQFAAGNAAMHLGEVYQFPDIANKANFEIGAVLFPAGPDSNLPYMLDTSNASPLVMSANTKNPADVALVMNEFAGADLLPWEEYYYDMFYNEEVVESMRLFRDLVRGGKYLIDYGTCVGNTYEIGIHGGLTAVSKGEKTPAQVIEEVQGKLQNAINAFN